MGCLFLYPSSTCGAGGDGQHAALLSPNMKNEVKRSGVMAELGWVTSLGSPRVVTVYVNYG